MTISGPDLSNFQAGLVIQPGTQFVIAKATEGTYYKDASYINFMQQAANVGAVRSAYHFLKQEGSAADQARFAFSFVGTMCQMLDVETEGSSKPGMLEIMSYINTTKALGGRVWGVYLPHWYWQEIGSPDLTPIANAGAVLVSSAYDYIGADNGPGWAPYGGLTPALWQFTDRLAYGGQHVDFNAFKGTQDELYKIFTGVDRNAPAPSGGIVTTQPPATSTNPTGLAVWGWRNPQLDGTEDMRQRLVNAEAAATAANTKADAILAELAAIKAKLGA